MAEASGAARIERLLAAMTPAERIGQLVMLTGDMAVTGPGIAEDAVGRVRRGEAGAILNVWGYARTRALQRVAVEESRLRIPLLFGFDAIHGHRTILPAPIAEAGAFDPGLWQRTAALTGAEAARDGIAWSFAPMLDIARDLRWGRMVEGPGEDPWLAAQFARAKVEGLQSAGIAATAKHFVGYGASRAGRDYAQSELSPRSLEEVHLPPFRAAVEAGVLSVMPAFTEIDGVPLTAHRVLLGDVLRGRWGFAGVIVSDYTAIDELIAHGVAADHAEAAALALAAGVDIDMVGRSYALGLAEALARGLVTEAMIEASVRRVLTLKDRLGLLDDPYRFGVPGGAVPDAASRALARDAARRSIVLLSHRLPVLPLDPPPASLALLGPLAASAADLLGPWAGDGRPDEAVSLAEGIARVFDATEIRTAPGVPDETALDAALRFAQDAEAIVLALGESREMSGEAASRARPGLPADQERLARAVLALERPVVVLLVAGRPLTVPWLFERAAAVLALWHPGSEGGHAVADVLAGRWNPSARLAVSWPHDVGQAPISYDERPGGRPFAPGNRYTSRYLDLPNAPQFPFGHGLSYSRFELGAPVPERRRVRAGERLAVTVPVENHGPRAGETKVFLFSRDPVASVSRPLLELRAVERVALAAGARATVRFELAIDRLGFIGSDGVFRVEPGEIRLYAGPSADRSLLREAVIEIVA